jgi:hypothetical protein
MRRVLVDAARARKFQKRGAGAPRSAALEAPRPRSARNIAPGDAPHETTPFNGSESVRDEHRPSNPFREGDLDRPVAVVFSFRTHGCDLDQQCDGARERREADVTSIDLHKRSHGDD